MTRDFLNINDFLVLLEYADSNEETIDTCGFDEDVIAFAFYGSGNVDLNVRHGALQKNYNNTKGLAMSFFANKNVDFIHTISETKKLHCVVILYSLKNLKQLPDEEREIYSEYVNELINPTSDYVEGPIFFMDHNMQNAVDKIFTNTYEGATKSLFLKSQVTELLSHFFAKASTMEKDNNTSLKDTEREKLYQAREILSKNMETPPSIAELSRLIGLNDFKLKKNFKELFGFPVYKYLQNERLIKAHEILSSKDVSIQEAAWSVGYESLSSFSNAFIKKYGFRPSEVKS
ncbi:AraC family transcriptional regulator [uncultured Eudoraea sp.]|uniref:helix-turn-helix domain-containing protein n=1 Tax=uncultured Eudoraea sp. TaxID=1035614 RepID=UPI0026110C1C|nr:AraC family transcriptional regulator [uncultured Eudoraea sp.]